MRWVTCAILGFIVSSRVIAQAPLPHDVTTTISVVIYQCIDPKKDPACVAGDETSKATSCPSCKSWEKVPISASVSASFSRSYSQPKLFLDDVSKQAYGEALAKNQDG